MLTTWLCFFCFSFLDSSVYTKFDARKLYCWGQKKKVIREYEKYFYHSILKLEKASGSRVKHEIKISSSSSLKTWVGGDCTVHFKFRRARLSEMVPLSKCASVTDWLKTKSGFRTQAACSTLTEKHFGEVEEWLFLALLHASGIATAFHCGALH